MNSQKANPKSIFSLVLYTVLIALAVYVVFKYLLVVVLPFIIAWVLAYLLKKPISFLKEKCKIPKKLSAIILIIIVITIVSALVFFLFNRLFSELTSLYDYAKANSEYLSESVMATVDKLESAVEKLPFSKFFDSEDLSSKIREMLTNSLFNIATNSVEKIPSFLSSVISLVPKLLIFIIILIFSAYYLTFDDVNKFFLAQFNDKAKHIIVETKGIFFDVVTKFIKAYVILFFVTLGIMFLGLAIIGVRFAFVAALLIAIVDLLPILGSGTVLLPWSVISLISADYAMSIKLVVLYIAITFIRQFLQPRIVGDFIGLHPLASLLSMFAGYAIMGFGGMFLFPLVLIILKTMNDRGTIHLWNNPQ